MFEHSRQHPSRDIAEYLRTGEGLEAVITQVHYNGHGLLNVSLYWLGINANQSTRNVTFDLRTGAEVQPGDVFRAATVPRAGQLLISRFRVFLGPKRFTQLWEKSITLTPFRITTSGLRFTNWYFMHEPVTVSLTWSELAPYISTDGLLARTLADKLAKHP